MLGVLFTSKLVRYLLENYTVETYAAMIGLVGGSIIAIFQNIEWELDIHIITASLITFIGGFVFVLILKQTQDYRVD